MIVIEASVNAGFWSFNGLDLPKGHFGIKYDGDLQSETERNFTLYNIYSQVNILKSRHYSEVTGVNSWDELSQLLNSLGVITEAGITSIVTPYELQVAQFQVPGVSVVDKFGTNLDIQTGTDPEDIWEFGGLYNYDAFGTAPIQYISSSDNADTMDVNVQGLDIDGYLVEQTITLQGQAVVNLNTALWRVFRMENEGDVNATGIIYCHTDPTPTNGVPAAVSVRAIINNGKNQTSMCLYTVPKDKVAFLWRGEAGVENDGNAAQLAEYARVQYQSRRLGKVFKVKKSFTLIVGGTSIYTDKRTFPDIIPELTDIKITAAEVSTTMGLWGTMDFQLFDKSALPASLLSLLGM